MFNLATQKDLKLLRDEIKYENDARWRLWHEFNELRKEYLELLELLGIERVKQEPSVLVKKK